MVAHEHPGVNRDPTLLRVAPKPLKINRAIRIRKKAVGTIVAALYNVQRKAGKIGSGAAWHVRINAGGVPCVDLEMESRL